MTTADKIKQLIAQLDFSSYDAFFLPIGDAHFNEYVPDCWQRIAWLTGFTGSNAYVLIRKNAPHAFLTDGRYTLQAKAQLDEALFEIQILGDDAPTLKSWLLAQIKKDRLAYDSTCISVQLAKDLQEHLALDPVHVNAPIDAIWSDQPSLPSSPLQVYPIAYAGQSFADKIKVMEDSLAQHSCDALMVSALDQIAWLFNLRGQDVACSPLFIAYAWVSHNNVILWADANKLTDQVREHLGSDVECRPYEQMQKDLSTLKAKKVWLDPNQTSIEVYDLLSGIDNYLASSPLALPIACKNKVESSGMREAHLIDGMAVTRFIYWLSSHWQEGVSEISAADELERFRKLDSRYLGPSFPTISGFAENGAIVHYQANEASNRVINDQSLYLFDSGGQYLEGTTDITRVLHLGVPTEEQRQHYTLVLKGHLDLSAAFFPEGVAGDHLDAIARYSLWQAGLDYAHGTGHGVGCYLNVHEGPQRIGRTHAPVALKAGMVVSNEPGFYLSGSYGIRIENLCQVIPVETSEHASHFLRFETLTMVPYERKLIDLDLLTDQELSWLNRYHRRVFNALKPHLNAHETHWLAEKTQFMQR